MYISSCNSNHTLSTNYTSYSERRSTPWQHKEARVNGIRLHYVQADPVKRKAKSRIHSNNIINNSHSNHGKHELGATAAGASTFLQSQQPQQPCMSLSATISTMESNMTSSTQSYPLILLLHGFPDFWYSWRHQLQSFPDNCVIAVDLRGYNYSEKARAGTLYTLNTLSDDIQQLILHLLQQQEEQDKATTAMSSKLRSGGGPAHPQQKDEEDETGAANHGVVLVGHDWGGLVAQAVAARFPDLVQKLVILNAPTLSQFQTLPARWTWRQRLVATFLSCPYRCIPEYLLGCNQSWLLARLFWRDEEDDADESCNKTLRLYRDAMSQPGALCCMLNHVRNLHASIAECREYNQQLHPCPMMVLWGTKELQEEGEFSNIHILACPPSKDDAKPSDNTDHVQFVQLDQGGHWAHQEQPEVVNRLILRFLTEESDDQEEEEEEDIVEDGQIL